jgi:hypothetical protein
MPCTPSQVEKLRKYRAKPTTSPVSDSATSANAAGCDPNRASRSWSGVTFTWSADRS